MTNQTPSKRGVAAEVVAPCSQTISLRQRADLSGMRYEPQCQNCLRVLSRLHSSDRCRACYQYRSVHGVERPVVFNGFLAQAQPADALSTTEVMRRTGITFRQINYWVHRGYVCPSHSVAWGSGVRWWWTDEDAALLASVKARLDYGMTLVGAFRTEEAPPLVRRSGESDGEIGELH